MTQRQLALEHQDLARPLRDALLPGDPAAAEMQALNSLPKLSFTDEASARSQYFRSST
jgi:hypothetical protein